MPVARVSGVELYYRLDGDENAAQTIVFSNSLSSNLSMWDAQISAMVAAGYRTVRYDTRGHGPNKAPDDAQGHGPNEGPGQRSSGRCPRPQAK